MKKKLIVLTICCVSMFQMGMVALSPIVASVTEAFPGTSQVAAQSAATFLNLIMTFTSLCSGKVAKVISRKAMVLCGMGLVMASGFLGAFLTAALWHVYLWSGLIGLGTGLFVPAVSSMMVDCISDEQRDSVAGLQTASVNLGGMLLSLFAGILAATTWTNAYLVFGAALIPLLLSAKSLSRENRETEPAQRSAKLPYAVWIYTISTLIFGILYFTFTTNISLLMAERGGVDTTLSGTATAVFMLGGCLLGFLFKSIVRGFGDKTAAFAFCMVAVSHGLIFLVDHAVVLMVAAFVGGGSLSVLFPFFLLKLAEKVSPEQSVTATSMVLCVGPNFGSFLSPFIITNLAGIFGITTIAGRFGLSAGFSLAAMTILLVAAAKNKL